MSFSKIFINTHRTLVFLLLTVLTQTGGIVYLINFSTYRTIDNRILNVWFRRLCKLGTFILIYLLATFLIVPLLARPFDRVQLPVRTTNNLQPLTFLTCLLNRNYVRKDLREVAFRHDDHIHVQLN